MDEGLQETPVLADSPLATLGEGESAYFKGELTRLQWMHPYPRTFGKDRVDQP